jgi:hypothetical protein
MLTKYKELLEEKERLANLAALLFVALHKKLRRAV